MTYTFRNPAYAQLDQAVNAQRWEILEHRFHQGDTSVVSVLNERFGTQFSPGDFKALADRYQSTRTVKHVR